VAYVGSRANHIYIAEELNPAVYTPGSTLGTDARVAQTGWEIATALPGVDLVGLTNSQREIALQTMRAESCTCDCAMKIAQCRMGDPACVSSRRLAHFVVTMASAGKSKEAVREVPVCKLPIIVHIGRVNVPFTSTGAPYAAEFALVMSNGPPMSGMPKAVLISNESDAAVARPDLIVNDLNPWTARSRAVAGLPRGFSLRNRSIVSTQGRC